MTLTIDKITAGDLARLKDGRTIAVDSIATMYADASGEHQGPFVTTRGAHEFIPLTEVAEIVATNPHRCQLCGGGVTSKDPVAYPYCSGCHYTGRVEEHLRSAQLDRWREQLEGAIVSVWHTGGGCMMLVVQFADEAEAGAYYGVTDGEASLPMVDEKPLAEGGWGLVIHYASEEDCEGETVLAYFDGDSDNDKRYWEEYPSHSFSDERVIEAIRADHERRQA